MLKTVGPARRTAWVRDWRWEKVGQMVPYGQDYKRQVAEGAGGVVIEGSGRHGESLDLTR